MVDIRIERLTPEQITELRSLLLANAVPACRCLASFAVGPVRQIHSLALLGFEELAKLQPLWSLRLDPEETQGTDWNYLRTFMTRHNDKIAVALFTEYLLEAVFGLDDHEECIVTGLTPLSELEDEAKRLNLLKQAGFYVEFDDIRFSMPSGTITERMATVTVARLKGMLDTFAAFNTLVSLPSTPTKEQILEAKQKVHAQRQT